MIDIIVKSWLKFSDILFEIKQFLSYYDMEIMVVFVLAITVLFMVGAKNLALLMALIYIMAKVTK